MSGKRNKVEKWLDQHNHFMEFLRTLFGLVNIVISCIILGKVFGVY